MYLGGPFQHKIRSKQILAEARLPYAAMAQGTESSQILEPNSL